MNLESAQLSCPARHFRVLLSPTPRGARLARLLAAEWLRCRDLPYGVTDAAEHVVAELAANAVAHARLPGRDFLVVLSADVHVLRIEVTDTRGDSLPPLIPQPPAPESESGRGLFLVEALADRWGVAEGPVPRKTVWAELDLVRPEPVNAGSGAPRDNPKGTTDGEKEPSQAPPAPPPAATRATSLTQVNVANSAGQSPC
ncbi:ATP-binding protein [Streptomyces sp. NPDC048527]|uniref:ATP-binding protein n=1 Tax=Streptomyces sp. NPDC048527 TaxID=3365568 RepID=UPI003723461F